MKHKLICKYGITKYVIKSEKNQQIDEMAVQVLQSRRASNLLVVQLNKKRNYCQLIYDVTGFIPFVEFLQQPMTKSTFIQIVRGIVNIFQVVQDHHLEIAKVNFDLNSIFVNTSNYALYFIYVPLQNCDMEVRLKDMLLSIPQNCSFPANSDNSYVMEFLNFVNSQAGISMVQLNDLLAKLSGVNVSMEQGANGSKKCIKCGADLLPNAGFCIKCGQSVDAALKSTSGKLKSQVYDPFEEQHPVNNGQKTGTGNLSKSKPVFQVDSEALRRNDAPINGTTVLGQIAQTSTCVATTVLSQPSYPFIIRTYTGEKVMVDHSPFRIGRDRNQVDYQIPDNSAVGRYHADIILENGKYYIRDRNSTNYTYLDGRKIQSMELCELQDDTQIRLANEDFTFYMPQEGI